MIFPSIKLLLLWSRIYYATSLSGNAISQFWLLETSLLLFLNVGESAFFFWSLPVSQNLLKLNIEFQHEKLNYVSHLTAWNSQTWYFEKVLFCYHFNTIFSHCGRGIDFVIVAWPKYTICFLLLSSFSQGVERFIEYFSPFIDSSAMSN